jgi:hypothetical protein
MMILKKNLSLYCLALVCTLTTGVNSYAQSSERKTTVNFYGAIDFTLNRPSGKYNSFFTLGEQDFFVTSRISDRISFLSETVVKFDPRSATTFSPSIERAQMKFDYYKNHSIIAGKIHSPVNFWNDVYHHGRVFFPTIDRPVAFSHFIPLHTLGVRLMGQGLGNLNFGYDLVAGNGISSTDVTREGTDLSFTASAHIKPVDGMRIQAGFYNDLLKNNKAGVHSGQMNQANNYKKDVRFRMLTTSFAYFTEKFEFLNESLYNFNDSDSLGRAKNYSSYTYLGYRLDDNRIPFLLFDITSTDDNELHVAHVHRTQFGLGFRYEFNYLLNLKIQLMRSSDFHDHNGPEIKELDKLFLKIQLAYGL